MKCKNVTVIQRKVFDQLSSIGWCEIKKKRIVMRLNFQQLSEFDSIRRRLADHLLQTGLHGPSGACLDFE